MILLEGCYARSGLLSDVQLYEEFPSRYLCRCQQASSVDSRRLATRNAGCYGACPLLPTAISLIRCRRCRNGS